MWKYFSCIQKIQYSGNFTGKFHKKIKKIYTGKFHKKYKKSYGNIHKNKKSIYMGILSGKKVENTKNTIQEIFHLY